MQASPGQADQIYRPVHSSSVASGHRLGQRLHPYNPGGPVSWRWSGTPCPTGSLLLEIEPRLPSWEGALLVECGDTASTPRCAGPPTVLTSLPLTAPTLCCSPAVLLGLLELLPQGPHWGPPIPCLFPLSPHLLGHKGLFNRTFCTWHLLPNPRRVNCMRTGLSLAQCSTREPWIRHPIPTELSGPPLPPGSPPVLRGVAGQQDLLPAALAVVQEDQLEGVRNRGAAVATPWQRGLQGLHLLDLDVVHLGIVLDHEAILAVGREVAGQMLQGSMGSLRATQLEGCSQGLAPAHAPGSKATAADCSPSQDHAAWHTGVGPTSSSW